MAQLVYLKENIKYFYQKHSEYLDPAMKLLFSFIMLCLVQSMFQYNEAVNKPWLFLLVSVAQAFLPLSFCFYSAACLILVNLWQVSVEIFVVYLLFFIICYLLFVRVDGKHAFIIIVTPILFYLKLEYFLPVLLGMTVGFSGILPMAAGIFLYFFSLYTRDASALLTTTENLEPGIGMSRITSLLIIDRKLLVILITFCLIVFVSTILYQMFHEKAWMFSIIIGNVSLAVLLLFGRLIFELDYTIWRVFLEIVLAMGLATVVQFFKGIGDFSRIEKVSFEDDEYIYFVKAVPKIKAAQEERNVTDIVAPVGDGGEPGQEAAGVPGGEEKPGDDRMKTDRTENGRRNE